MLFARFVFLPQVCSSVANGLYEEKGVAKTACTLFEIESKFFARTEKSYEFSGETALFEHC